MLELFSEYTWSKKQKTLPYEHHGISGIGELTHIHSMSTTVPPPLHYHCDFIEIYCMLSGSRHTTVHENGNIQSYSVSGNEAFLVYPFELHSNGERPQPPCEYFAFQIRTTDPEHMLLLNPESSWQLYARLFSIKSRHLRLSGTDISLLRSAFSLLLANSQEEKACGAQFLTCFLFQLLRRITLSKTFPVHCPWRRSPVSAVMLHPNLMSVSKMRPAIHRPNMWHCEK